MNNLSRPNNYAGTSHNYRHLYSRRKICQKHSCVSRLAGVAFDEEVKGYSFARESLSGYI